jgi:F-type H+-transporting ATPase subunit gamma
MASARDIKKRIRSVSNIGQITRALESISASRVRRAQARVLASRAYSEKAWEIMLNIQSTAQKGTPLHPLLTDRGEIKKVLMVLVTSERGLAGAYNSNITRVAQRFEHRVGVPVEYIAIGRKGRDTLIRSGAKVIAEFTLSGEPTIAEISPAIRLATEGFLSGEYDDVSIAYTDFVNTLTQRPVVQGWLPLIPHDIHKNVLASQYIKAVPEVTTRGLDYEYEPSATAILDEIVPSFTGLMLYQAILEAAASEHSARMVAMRNASDNAKQLVTDLTLVYNKARQAGITAEILDIVGGAEALSDSIDKAADQLLMKFQHEVANQPRQIPTVPAAVATKPDNLTKVEGIGPKMAQALIAAGIDTFAKLAAVDETTLHTAIEAAGMKFAPSLPTWPLQAKYLAAGDFEGLKQYQQQLVSGRES